MPIIPAAFASRDSQTRIKHEILHAYAGAWASIILHGLRRYPGATAPLAYVDAFAGAGRYGRDTGGPPDPAEPVWGSPIIALRAIEAAMRAVPSVTSDLSALAIEENAEHFGALCVNAAEAQTRTPAIGRERVDDAQRGELTLINGDFPPLVPDVLAWLSRFTHALTFVDPYGAAMHMTALAPLIARERTDSIVLFPVMDIDRKAASVRKHERDLKPGDRGNITRVQNVFGCDDWRDIAREEGLTLEQREGHYTALYDRLLKGTSPGLIVKQIPLRLSSAERIGYSLFLTTRDSSGALRMNEVLRRAELREHNALWQDYVQRERDREAATGQDNFFDMLGVVETVPEIRAPERVEPARVAEVIKRLCPPGEHTTKSIATLIADEIFTESEMHSGLRYLRSNGGAAYDGELKAVRTKVRIL